MNRIKKQSVLANVVVVVVVVVVASHHIIECRHHILHGQVSL